MDAWNMDGDEMENHSTIFSVMNLLADRIEQALDLVMA